MRLAESAPLVAEFTPDKFEDLRRHIDPEWILQALKATGTASIRTRRLPAQHVVWLVIGMALFRDRSIPDIVSKLDLALPGPTPTVAPSTISEARVRLGADPMQWLFSVSADHWAHQSARRHAFRGLAVYGVDGTVLRVPDSPDNAAHFGYAKSSRGQSAYPLCRAVGLMALRSHLLASVAFGPSWESVLCYARDLWPHVPDDSLTIPDKGFLSAGILLPLCRDGKSRHFLIRAKKNQKWRVLKRLGKKDCLVELDVFREARPLLLPEPFPSICATYGLRSRP